MVLSYSASCLIGAILESMAYGLYLSYFIQGLQVILGRKNGRDISISLLLTSLVLFFLITMRMALDNKAIVAAFTDNPLEPNAADIYMENYANGAMFRTGTYIALTIVADIFIVFRVYAVWGGSVIAAAVPSLLAIADIVTGALLIQTIRELEAGASPDGGSLATHEIVFYSFTLTLNVLCTILISLRIYLTQRTAAGVIISSLDLTTTMAIVIESAAIYSACLIAMIVPTALDNNVQYVLLSLMPGIVGIAFSLIIVRIGSGLSPHSAAGPMSSLRFGSKRRTATTQFETTDGMGTQASQGDEIPVHLMSHGSHSNGMGGSQSDGERARLDEEKEQV
ncbi:hypothetical protein DFH07DRAFT_861395 [Mycena maculata]|uniref:Uncharacterized protein n=1 Tax=Mycena maculata TaxID=230809 RepID=A0AAD7MHB4_9AGAR|nr:hypothetical protein DFH07DRAFT_861395 [Mycena maculata]